MARYREILSYFEMQHREGLALQRGMNFRVRGGAAGYSIILMSLRANAPYQDQWHEDRGLLEYEGHDAPQARGAVRSSKHLDQPLALPSGKPTENGKFFEAAQRYKQGLSPPEAVQVYEKIANGIWCDRGRHVLVDAVVVETLINGASAAMPERDRRLVCRFFLKPSTTATPVSQGEERELSLARRIPTAVKVDVWKRDHGRCVVCGATDNLHFDHEVPYSKGGSSIVIENVRVLCARHNLEKSDRIMCLGPLLLPLLAASVLGLGLGA